MSEPKLPLQVTCCPDMVNRKGASPRRYRGVDRQPPKGGGSALGVRRWNKWSLSSCSPNGQSPGWPSRSSAFGRSVTGTDQASLPHETVSACDVQVCSYRSSLASPPEH